MNKSVNPTLALTAGEPAGIGPDLCIQLAQQTLPGHLIVIADAEVLLERAKQLHLPLQIREVTAWKSSDPVPGYLSVMHVPAAQAAVPGVLNPANAQYVLETLKCAVEGCQSGFFKAMITAPVHKGVINDAGMAFTGHTEFLAELTGSRVVMMLVGGRMRVALATTHLPLKEVPAAITPERIESKLRIIHQDLQRRFLIDWPRIAVTGLNPHAGESGHLGREEIDVIIPALDKLRAEGMRITGPVPADTIFNVTQLAHFDCIFAMYHDQGLPVLKHASFGGGVNVTLGLPIIRTSVDHGTALDLAATGRIHGGSLMAAIELASQLATNQIVTSGNVA